MQVLQIFTLKPPVLGYPRPGGFSFSIETTETSLLGAFYGWARPMEVRVQGISTMMLGFDERLALSDQRISELERKRTS